MKSAQEQLDARMRADQILVVKLRVHEALCVSPNIPAYPHCNLTSRSQSSDGNRQVKNWTIIRSRIESILTVQSTSATATTRRQDYRGMRSGSLPSVPTSYKVVSENEHELDSIGREDHAPFQFV